MTALGPQEGQRIDRWLWFTRLFKSRSLASKAVEAGAVRITRAGQTIRTDKPSYALKAGDVVTLKIRGTVRVLEVVSGGARRGPASEAQTLYKDLALPPSPALSAQPETAPSPRPPTRPDKRARRALEALKARDQLDEED
ncbi:MAG TPA: RNA-binding S4 domain-containing protein [Alphaproteobacteria bacterium]|nr:RNA-binding S4 domain-containing protein [Alphaproteobacteria bacterium]